MQTKDRTDNLIDVDETIDTWLLLNLTRNAIHRARQQELLQYGITPETSAVLHIIKDLGGSALPVEIARWTFRKLHSIHGLLERMEKSGLISKIKDSARKNGVRVMLTEQGLAIRRKTRSLPGRQKIMSSLSREQLEMFRQSLRLLLTAANKETGEVDEVILRPPKRDDVSSNEG